MKSKYDIHVATESGDNGILKKALVELGFQDDNLAQKGLIFDSETARYYDTCPLIDIHVSRKMDNHIDLREIEIKVHELMNASGLNGYWHSECIIADDHISSEGKFALAPLPFNRLSSRPRAKEKIWDIHISFRESLMPNGLGKMFIDNGIYYLSRLKRVPEGGEDKFAVYTVQGVNPLKEGRHFYTKMCEWLKLIGVPHCDVKLELTTAMNIYGTPRTVPPTIENIVWK